MTTETINGLHKCQPKNAPVEGEVKNMVVLHMPAKGDKKAYIKIKNELPEKGGTPHRILTVQPLDWPPDQYKNIAFNLEVEPSSSQPTAFQNARATMGQGRVPGDATRAEETKAQQGRVPAYRPGIENEEGDRSKDFLHQPDSDWPEAQQGKVQTFELKPTPAGPVYTKVPDDGIVTPIDEVRKRLMQAVNLEVLCIRAVDKGIAPHCPEIAQTADFFQSQVASLFIWATRQGLENKMPETPIK